MKTNPLQELNHDKNPALDPYPSIRAMLLLLEADNGSPRGYFDNNAVIGLTFMDVNSVEATATKALSTYMGDFTVIYDSADRTDTVAAFLAWGEHSEIVHFVEEQRPEFFALHLFLSLAFGEQDPEEFGLTEPHPEGIK